MFTKILLIKDENVKKVYEVALPQTNPEMIG